MSEALADHSIFILFLSILYILYIFYVYVCFTYVYVMYILYIIYYYVMLCIILYYILYMLCILYCVAFCRVEVNPKETPPPTGPYTLRIVNHLDRSRSIVKMSRHSPPMWPKVIVGGGHCRKGSSCGVIRVNTVRRKISEDENYGKKMRQKLGLWPKFLSSVLFSLKIA